MSESAVYAAAPNALGVKDVVAFLKKFPLPSGQDDFSAGTPWAVKHRSSAVFVTTNVIRQPTE